MSAFLSSSVQCLTVLVLFFVGGPVLAQAPESPPNRPLLKTGPASPQATVKKVPKADLNYQLQPPPLDFSPPVLTVREASFNWGVRMKGESVTHTFVIENTGGSPLKVERVKPSCGCTTVDFAKEIAPGGKGEVTLKVETKRLGGGTAKKTASVYCNAQRDAFKLTMEGKVESPISFEPKNPRIEFIRGTPGAPYEIKVRRTYDKPVEFKGVTVEESKQDILTVEWKEVEPGELYTIVATPAVPEGASMYRTVELNIQTVIDGRALDIPIRVSIRSKSRLEANPPSVYFTRKNTAKLTEGSPVTKTTTLKSLDPNHSFQIKDVQVSTEDFTANVEPVEAGKSYRLTVTLSKPPVASKTRLSSKITLTTDDELVPKLTVNVTASFGKPKARSIGKTPTSLTRPATAPPTSKPGAPAK